MSNLDSVMQQARQASENFQAPVPVSSNDNAISTVSGGIGSIDNFMGNSGIVVDEYLLPKTEGLKISSEMKGLLDDVLVEIDLTQVVPIAQVRCNTGGNTTFIKSYDGVTTSTGENMQTALLNARKSFEKIDGPYKTVEIPMTLVDDVKDPKGTLTFDAGTEIGYTPSLTGFKEFQKFWKKIQKQDPAMLSKTVKVKVSHLKRTNRNNNEWGVCVFELAE